MTTRWTFPTLLLLLTWGALSWAEMKVRIPSELNNPDEAGEPMEAKQGSLVGISNTTLGLRPDRDRAPANAPTNLCKLHASKLVWAPNLVAMLETSEFTTADFRIKREVQNEPVEFTSKNSAAVRSRLQNEKEQTDQVLHKFREFEELFQDLYGKMMSDELKEPNYEKREWLRAEYWVRETFQGFTKKQKEVLSKVMAKWIRHYFKGNIRKMASNEKRIVIKRINTFETILNKPKIKVSKIFCFDQK